MARRIVFSMPDGSVRVVIPSQSKYSDLDDLTTCAMTAIDNAGLGPTPFEIIEEEELPPTRRWRNAWRRIGAVVAPDLVEARKVRKAELARERDEQIKIADLTRSLAVSIDDVTTEYAARHWSKNLRLLDDTSIQVSVDTVTTLEDLDTHEPTAITEAKAAVLPTSGELTLGLREEAKATVGTSISREGKVLRAVASVLLDEVNILRGWLASFKSEVAAAASLADLKTRVATLPNTPDRTLAQAKAAIANRLDDGTVD